MANLKTGAPRKQSMPNFSKNEHSLPLIRTGTCVYQGVKNVCFSENLACFVFLKHPFWDLPFWLITNNLIWRINSTNSFLIKLAKLITMFIAPVISFICLANLPPPVSKDQLGARILAQERLDKAEVCQDYITNISIIVTLSLLCLLIHYLHFTKKKEKCYFLFVWNNVDLISNSIAFHIKII